MSPPLAQTLGLIGQIIDVGLCDWPVVLVVLCLLFTLALEQERPLTVDCFDSCCWKRVSFFIYFQIFFMSTEQSA